MNGYGKKLSTKTIILIVVAAVVVVLLGAGVFCFTVLGNSTNIYRKAITGTVDAAFATVNPKTKDKTNVDINIDCDVDLIDKEEEKNNPTIKALKETTLSINVKTDNEENKSVLHLKSNYGTEKLFDASIFMDVKESKAYIYAKDLMDKYIEVGMDSVEETTETEETTVKVNKKAMKVAEKILKEELSKVITDDMCVKSDGAYVLKTTSTKLVNNLKSILNALSENQEFLSCYENPEEIAEMLKSIDKALDVDLIGEYQVEVKLELSLFFKFQKVSLRVWDDNSIDATLVVTENLVTYDEKKDNKDSLNVRLETVTTKDSSNMKFAINMAEVGKINVTMTTKQSEVKTIDALGPYEVKKLNEMSFFDLMAIAENFTQTKLGKLVEEINEYNTRGIVDLANKAVLASDVANINDQLTLAYADLKLSNSSLKTFENLKSVTVNDKKYAGIEAYYKAIVPAIDENSTEYNVPEGYEVVFDYKAGTVVVSKIEAEDTQSISIPTLQQPVDEGTNKEPETTDTVENKEPQKTETGNTVITIIK